MALYPLKNFRDKTILYLKKYKPKVIPGLAVATKNVGARRFFKIF